MRAHNKLWVLGLSGILLYLRIWTIDQNLVEIVGDKLTEAIEKTTSSLSSSTSTSAQEQEGPVHVMYASDDHSLPGVQASIRSIMTHASGPVVFHYVGNTPLDITSSFPNNNVKFYNLTTVAKKYKLKQFTNPRERGENAYHGINDNLGNYARFAMDSLLGTNVSKAMWIDVDTIVRCDVVQMIRNALVRKDSENVIAAVPGESGPPRGFQKWVKKKYNLTAPSFNAGVYVVDLDKWREQNMTSKIREITQMNKKTKMYNLGSQSPLILAIGNNFERLPWTWNAKVSHFDRDDRPANEKEACVLHWSGGQGKPWEADGIHKDLWLPYASDESI